MRDVVFSSAGVSPAALCCVVSTARNCRRDAGVTKPFKLAIVFWEMQAGVTNHVNDYKA
jgi:hypothetical protein